MALHAVEAAPGQPSELERDPVAPLVQAEYYERMDVVADDAVLALEAVQLAVGDIEPLRGLHARGVGLDADGVLPGTGTEKDSVSHGSVALLIIEVPIAAVVPFDGPVDVLDNALGGEGPAAPDVAETGNRVAGASGGDMRHDGDGLPGVHGVLRGCADSQLLDGEAADGPAVLDDGEMGDARGQKLPVLGFLARKKAGGVSSRLNAVFNQNGRSPSPSSSS